MRKDKEKATELRRSGKSYKEISRTLGIPTATLSDWFRDLDWSIQIRNRLGDSASLAYPEKLARMVTANRERWETWRENYRQVAVNEFLVFKKNPVFLAGLMLYWGEGSKSMGAGTVRLANSDPEMVKLFYLFLKVIGIQKEKIKFRLLLYPDLVDTVQKKFWGKVVGIPFEQFKKSVFIRGKHPTRRLSYGVCNIEVYSRGLLEKMMKWLELYKRELI